MKDLRLFATKAFPLHPSGLRNLVICPWRVVLNFLNEPEDGSGEAADTGSAMHKAAHAFHTGKGVAESIAVMQSMLHEYPKADLKDAANLFLLYAGDPRNREAEVVVAEQPISFSIEPAPNDPTQERIEVEGTLDQVRREHGRLRLWDIKTTKKEPMQQLHKSLFQAAAYCIGGSYFLGEEVHPGGLIFPRRYPANALWPFTWKLADVGQILSVLQHRVAEVRSGILYHVPNEDCTWCSARTPDICLPSLIKLNTDRVRCI